MSYLQFERMTIFLILTKIFLKSIIEHRCKLRLYSSSFKLKYLDSSVIRCWIAKCALRFNHCQVVFRKSKDRLPLCYQHQKYELRCGDDFYVMIAIIAGLFSSSVKALIFFLVYSVHFWPQVMDRWNWREGNTWWRLHKTNMSFIAGNSWESRGVLGV